MVPEFPVEFIVQGTPVSFQADRAESKLEWKERVKNASSSVLPEGHWATKDRIAVTMFYFPDEPMEGDLDNIIKLILDALNRHIYMDDAQIDRIVAQRFERNISVEFPMASATLIEAINHPRPALYIRVSDDPLEELS